VVVPFVSVIIPCWNAEPFIGDAIRSALAQTYPGTEAIVIDDGSTDGSLEIIKSFGDTIRWETGPNRGGGAARNRGLELAKGEFVQFLDADDRLAPDKLLVAVERLSVSDADVCLCGFRVIDTDGSVTVAGPDGPPCGDALIWLLSNDVRICPLYRSRTVKSAGGFDSSLCCCQDFDLNLRIAVRGGRYVFVSGAGYEVRRQARSVSSDEVRLYRIMVQVLSATARQLEPESDDHDQRIVALAAKMSHCGRWLLRFGDVQGGLQAFRAAGSVHESGGLTIAYSLPALWLRLALGPVLAERLLWRIRRLRQAC
jgi:glycosyltransferase involved in cell wall biosynthesis